MHASSKGPISVGHSEFVRQTFADFSDVVVDFVGRADRTTMHGTLFDVPRRTEVTLPCYTAVLPTFYREVAKSIEPEELGLRMRRLAGRPNPLHVDGAHWQILLERERRLLLGLAPYPDDDLEFVFDYAGRVLAACRQDGNPFPCRRVGWEMRILDHDVVAGLVAQTREWSPEDVVAMRRLAASLELYSFMLHGEHRDGMFDHGPYRPDDDELVMIKDFTDLQSTFLPWSTPDIRLDHPALSIVSVLDPVVAPHINWVGTTAYLGGDPYDHLRRAAVFVVDDAGEPKLLERTQWDALGSAARLAQKQLFTRIVEWPEEEKIKYGRWLFANHLHSVPAFLGLDPGISEAMVNTLQVCVDRQYELLDRENVSPVWAALRRPQPFTAL